MDVLFATAIGLSLLYALSRSGKPKRLADGTIILRFGRGTWLFGAFCGIAIPTAIGWYLFKFGTRSTSDLYSWLGLISFFGVAGIYFLLIAWRIKIELSDSALKNWSILGKVTSIAWKDVDKVTFFRSHGYFSIHGRHGQRIQISLLLKGPLELQEKLKGTTAPSVHELACERYRRWRKLPL